VHSKLPRSLDACEQILAGVCFSARGKALYSSSQLFVTLSLPALLCADDVHSHSFRAVKRIAAYLTYRISLPIPAFRGLTSKPLRTAFSTGVACWTPCCSKANPSKSALPPSVQQSVASAIRVLDTGFDGRGGSRDLGRNLVNSGTARLVGGVDGRWGGAWIMGGSKTFVGIGGRVAGRGGSGGERMRVNGAFSSRIIEPKRRVSFWWMAFVSRLTTCKCRAVGICFCLELLACEGVKSERKFGTCRNWGG
jgi:hypothetical protein